MATVCALLITAATFAAPVSGPSSTSTLPGIPLRILRYQLGQKSTTSVSGLYLCSLIPTCWWNRRQDIESEFLQLVDDVLRQGLIVQAEADTLSQLAQSFLEGALMPLSNTFSEAPATTPAPSSSALESTSPVSSKS
ncbi:hypothetical protein EDC04DRAFT_2898692 [Pisolithus marmoratus]|nr:hypothetical protein EDC04DRAFT_2898692 [Pisolithus marmoratus]